MQENLEISYFEDQTYFQTRGYHYANTKLFGMLTIWHSILDSIIRFRNQGPSDGRSIFPSLAAMMSCEVSLLGCSGLKDCWMTVRDQAGSLYSLIERMTFFSSAMTLGSKHLTTFLHFLPLVIAIKIVWPLHLFCPSKSSFKVVIFFYSVSILGKKSHLVQVCIYVDAFSFFQILI